LFIKNVVNNAILVNKNIHFGIILILFIFIVTFNLIGMIPYTFTLTSIFIITFNVSAAFFLGSNIIAILLNKYVYTDLFMPKGVPTLITPFLLLIELISYFSRVFSLAIRLFANMLSGHILLKILMGLMWVSVNKQTVLIFIMPMAVLVISAVIGLELTIAFLQAYVFITLVCSYVNDAINVH
jgi:ATP synthase subunit 6